MSKIFTTLLFTLALFVTGGYVFAAFGDPFLSIQLAGSPSADYILSTNGTDNIWIENTGGGGGTVGTSSIPNISELAFWTTSGADTELLSGVATTSFTAGTGLSFTGTPGALVGGTNLTINAEVQTSDLHDAVTLSGTPDYITLSGQDIVRGTVDISDDTNLAVDSPITLTGDTLDFDFSLNNAWTGTGTTTFAGDIEIAGNLQVDGVLYAPITFTSGDTTITGTLDVTGALTLGTATTTASNGFDISDGCFAIDSVCLSGGSILAEEIFEIYSTSTPSGATDVTISFAGAENSAASFSAGVLTLPSNVSHVLVQLWGAGGGGGGGSDSGNGGGGGDGGDSTFGNGTATSTAGGATGGTGATTSFAGFGSAGGTCSGTHDLSFPGEAGKTGIIRDGSATTVAGGPGGGSPRGPGGGRGGGNASAGLNGESPGAGGGGGGGDVLPGGGGGAGCLTETLYTKADLTTYAGFTIGEGGTIGAAGTGTASAGGAGGNGGVVIYIYLETSSASGGGWEDSGTVVSLVDDTDTVGIGTSTPVHKLDVYGNIRAGIAGVAELLWDSATGFLGIGTTTPQWPVQIANSTGPQLALSDGSATSNHWTIRNINGNLYFATSSPSTFATSTAPNQPLTFPATGGVLFGTTTPDTFSQPAAATFLHRFGVSFGLAVYVDNTGSGAGLIRFDSPAGNIGSINTTGSGGVNYNVTSDERLKENITDTSMGLEELLNIQVRDFNFKKDPDKKTQQGFIAQELQSVYPLVVLEGGEDVEKEPWSVDYGRITPLIIQAIQDMWEVITGNQKRIDELEARIEALEAKLNEKD